MIVAIGTLFIASLAFGQDQERHLMDRLLKPDTTLANPAQNKKFADKQGTSFDKPAHVRTFYSPQKPLAKSFPEERTFNPREFAARHFRAGDSPAYIASRSASLKNDTMLAIPAATASTRVAPESNATVPTLAYSGNRPFLDQGKSQKALHDQDRPLTIEQVRELLNKSK